MPREIGRIDTRSRLEYLKEREHHDTNPGVITELANEVEALWSERRALVGFLGGIVKAHEETSGPVAPESIIGKAEKLLSGIKLEDQNA